MFLQVFVWWFLILCFSLFFFSKREKNRIKENDAFYLRLRLEKGEEQAQEWQKIVNWGIDPIIAEKMLNEKPQ